MGGIETGGDALEFIMAGATAIAVGTANFRDPAAPQRILAALEAEARRRGITSINALVGLANPGMRR
jgi:dihydroorotate dehydrogenase (NAD+) catalytic subunit